MNQSIQVIRETELDKVLLRRYPDLMRLVQEGKVFESFNFDDKHMGVTVTFHEGQRSSIAIFEYKENEPGESYWYCVSDWKD